MLPRRLANAPLVVAVLVSVLLSAPVASAALTDDVVSAVPDVGSVTEPPLNAVPDLPVPVETPDVPEVPAPVPLPSVSKPPPPAPAPTPSASSAAGAAKAVTGTAEEAVRDLDSGAGGIARAPLEAEGPVAGTGARSGSGARPVARSESDRRSIGPAEKAPPQRWRAYVWPAIALGFRHALMPLLSRLDGFADVHVPDVMGLLSPFAAPGSGVARSVDLPSGRAHLPNQDLQLPPEGTLPSKGMSLLVALLIGLLTAAGLVALAKLLRGDDLLETRYWRSHRG